MDYKKLIKSLDCDGSGIRQDVDGCSNRRCKYRDADGACNLVRMCSDASTAITALLERAEAAEARAEKAERERDAAIHDIFEAASAKCFWCKHQDKKWLSDGKMDGLCYTCLKNKKVNWEWRGIKEE